VRHADCGRAKAWALSESIRHRILDLARNMYAGFNDSHLTVKLVEVEKVTVSRETVRRLLRNSGLRSPQKRRARKYRVRRERKPGLGMMVLGDASRNQWLEQRGPGNPPHSRPGLDHLHGRYRFNLTWPAEFREGRWDCIVGADRRIHR
jgi:hypothetical protein